MTDTETENGKIYNEAFQAYYVYKDYDKAFSMLTQLAEEEDYFNFAKYHLYLLYTYHHLYGNECQSSPSILGNNAVCFCM